MTLAFLLILCGGTAWSMPYVLEPPWHGPRNQDPGYPEQLLATADIENIPLLGEDDMIFSRIDLVERKNGRVYLKDPFSGQVLREATGGELDVIGDGPYVMERFGRPADHELILTFDDGPSGRYTPEILDLLSREQVPATFFILGGQVAKYPDIFRRIIREGHLAANHTMTHYTMTDAEFLPGNELRGREEIIGADRIMRAVGGYATRLFRIPRGDPDNNPLALLQAQQLGYLHVDFDLDTLDWQYPAGAEIKVPELDGRGHVVLMHDGGGDRAATVRMLGKLIAEAKAKGYTFSTVAPMLTPGYQPRQGVEPVPADHLMTAASAALFVAPSNLLGWLFWFGLGSLAIMSALYVVLALICHHRQKRLQWQAVADVELPFVSIILPVYNEEPVVLKTLAALRASDYPAFEVIAVNDGSTDNTLAVLRQHARQWPQLRVLTQSNAGKSAASNFGISQARGGIIVTLDGDTVFEPQTVRMLARHFLGVNGGRVGAVAGHVKVGNRRNLLTAWQSLEYISGICVTRMAEGLIGAISIVPGACAAWRREALVQAGGYSHDTMAEDADLTLYIQKLGYRIVQENQAVAWTEAPMTVRGLAKQRLRWTYGNLQALWKHKDMILRPRYGALGMVALPYTLLATVIPLLFMPLTAAAAAISAAAGNWHSIAAFAAFVALTHMVISVIAIRMVRESPMHLLVVPVYRLIYEPLRAYLLYGNGR
ncbi:bifunctional polysaccharide deacetylase/glycosyltransferase family 2 protein [Arthrobacter sp. GCM10027362]|uniref:bifunctional polysaccharide deacetylase/glycosyltransferase family 2 protein n=1 Tax=Arthrobacter sp. GCM10027362 TaxID=3273379 RepID=UPI00363DEAB9